VGRKNSGAAQDRRGSRWSRSWTKWDPGFPWGSIAAMPRDLVGWEWLGKLLGHNKLKWATLVGLHWPSFIVPDLWRHRTAHRLTRWCFRQQLWSETNPSRHPSWHRPPHQTGNRRPASTKISENVASVEATDTEG
jgi:hypothetical protein